MLHKVRDEIIRILQTNLGPGIEVELSEPPQIEMGDFSFACFELAKAAKQNPVQLAAVLREKIVASLSPQGLVREVQAVGPYLNFFIDQEKITTQVLSGPVSFKGSRGTVLMDVFQANSLKAFHIGHVRNAALGESIRRILAFVGYKTKTYSYYGDVGINIARWLWYFEKFYQGAVPKAGFNKWAGEIYAQAAQKVAEKPEYEAECQEYNRRLDQRDPKLVKIWKKLCAQSYAGSQEIKKELNCQVDYFFPESVCEAPGKKYVQAQIKAGKLKKDQGAWVIDLDKYDLGVFILLKSDGTALYQTKDYGLAELRRKKVSNFTKLLFVVGSEQEFYFRQLFKSMAVLGYPGWDRNYHVAHGLVSLQDGKMASRLGNVIVYEDLRNETIKRVLAEINKRNASLKNKAKVAEVVAFGAIKFAMLSVDNTRPIKFDWDAVLDFEGDTGPYLQYTYARIRSISRKSGHKKLVAKVDYSLLANIEERRLIKVLSRFSNVITKAADEYRPSLIANYLLNLASEFNHFYHACKVIDQTQPKLMSARLVLIDKVASTIQSGLALLGIETVEEM
ncbi:MAG: arginine--tRNA ligase [Patescibacteria group bacterium]